MATRHYAIAASAIVALGLGTGIYMATTSGSGDRFDPCRTAAIPGDFSVIGGPFELTDHTGAQVTAEQVIDQPTLMYFGYTWCPDVCPIDTVRNADAVDLLAERDISVKPVFVSVDPERDTPEALADFVSLVHDDMVGLTGTQDQVEAASRGYRVYAAKNGSGDDYLMDHSTLTYFMAPGEGFLTYFDRTMPPELMADQMACFIERL